jgi:hypothetical protein
VPERGGGHFGCVGRRHGLICTEGQAHEDLTGEESLDVLRKNRKENEGDHEAERYDHCPSEADLVAEVPAGCEANDTADLDTVLQA